MTRVKDTRKDRGREYAVDIQEAILEALLKIEELLKVRTPGGSP